MANAFYWSVMLALLALGVVSGSLESLGLAGFMLVYLFLVPPLRLRSRLWQPARPIYEPIDFDVDVSLGGDTLFQASRETIAKLAPEGFIVRGHFRRANQPPLVAGFVSLFENPRRQETARLVVARTRARSEVMLVFFTRFEDGTEVRTGNNRQLTGFPRPASETGIWLPHIRDAWALYQIHKLAADQLGAGKKRVLDTRDAATVLRETTRQEISGFVDAGYYYLDDEAEKYRFTWKGAFLITWRLMWPVSMVYRALRRRRTMKQLHELGIDLHRNEGRA
jgi:hypothetical protein